MLARTDAGHAGLDFEPVDLEKILSETYQRARPLADARNHKLTLHSDAKATVLVVGDAPSLRRLLWILVDNAIRYTPENGRVRLALQVTGAEACVLVQDSGPGIPEPRSTISLNASIEWNGIGAWRRVPVSALQSQSG